VARRIAVSSVIRNVPPALESGRLRVIDLDSGRTLLTAPIPQSAHRGADPNPRGGLRGGRGVSFSGDRFVLANTERMFVFDRKWQMVGELSNSWTADIHEILAEPDGIWVTCAACDLLLKLGWDGEVLASWSWRSDRGLAAGFGFDSLPALQEGIDYRDPRQRGGAVHDVGHLNAVTRARDGLIVSLGRVLTPRAYRTRRLKRRARRAAAKALITRPAVTALGRRYRRKARVDLLPNPDRRPGSSALVMLSDPTVTGATPAADVLFRQDGLDLPNHNALEVGDLLVYNDTNGCRLVAHDRRNGSSTRSVQVPGDPGYARGLAWLGDETFVVGSQRPPALHTIDLRAGRVTSSAVIGRDQWESVSSIALIPDSFDDPPERLRLVPPAPRR
jgi:hypothetical protein